MGTEEVAPVPGRTRYLLCWLDQDSMMDASTLRPIRRAIEDLVTAPRDQVEIDVWLESPGGDAHAAYKLALILQDAACHVRVIVPDYAKSAATLLALAGDEIYLAPAAELGPLDAQIPEEGSLFGAISALNTARAADAVAQDAVTLARTGGAELLMWTGLSRADTLNAMLRFSAAFSEPLVRQLDPKLVHHAKELLRVTTRYAERLLGRSTGGNKASEIAAKLVEDFPTHGFVIALEEAGRLGLPTKPLKDYEYLDLVRAFHRAAEDGQTVIEFMSMDEFLAAWQDDERETEKTGDTDDDIEGVQDEKVAHDQTESENAGSHKATVESGGP